MNLIKDMKNLASALLFAFLAVFGVTSSIAAEGVQNLDTEMEMQFMQMETVNINTASAEQLAMVLNGVGEKKAQEIIAFREANGRFAAPVELVEVKGIGSSTFEKNRDRIVIE